MSYSIDAQNAAAYQYQLSIQDTFNKICEPIFNLGISYFYYAIHFMTGEHIQFSNHDELIRDHYLYIKRPGSIIVNAYLELLSKDPAKNAEKSCFLVPYDKKDQDQVIDLVVSKNLWNGFVIIKREVDHVKTYAFGTATESPLFSQFYFKNLALLEHFCEYFDEKAKDIIDCSDKTKFGYLKFAEQSSNNYSQENSFHNTQKFLQETFIEKEILSTKEQDIHLSKRELECLHYLSLGKSIKEIGIALDLSPRSIEFYLQNIKKRSGLKRGELITYFARNFSV